MLTNQQKEPSMPLSGGTYVIVDIIGFVCFVIMQIFCAIGICATAKWIRDKK
ncbi:hypothetical protein P8864_10430 [Priestia flexa]|uniref:hypothetical protein n=1 Tax=Priestia flexa TaxID=86664 RepID=UPI0012FE7A0E|nr:hypothetical protein [Priestia flexa]MEC0666305.1 hypothetical protein [Priestia flexa]